MKLFGGTEDLLAKYLKDEDVKAEEVGYRPDTNVVALDNGGDFDEFKR